MQVHKFSRFIIAIQKVIKVNNTGEKNRKAISCETDSWSKQKGRHKVENTVIGNKN